MNEEEKEEKPKWMIRAAWAVFGVLVFVFFLPATLKWINSWGIVQGCDFCWITEDISTWFTFWGSLLGIIVSIVLAAITLSLTDEIEKHNRQEARVQNLFALIMETPYMRCNEIKIYSQNHNDILKEYITTNSSKQEYMLNIEMEPSFPTFFKVIVDKIEIVLPDNRKGGMISHVCELEQKYYKILSNEKFCLYIDMPDAKKDFWETLYTMDIWAPSDSPAITKSSCEVILNLRLFNELYLPSDKVMNEAIKLEFYITTQNEGAQQEFQDGRVTHKYKRLKVINTTMKRIE